MQNQANTAMQTQRPQQVQANSNAGNSDNQRTGPSLLPPVDIFEDAGGITLLADLPGVGREDLSIGVDGRQLTIEAPLSLGEASRVLGISQGTLRRWADRGQVASFTTPGGHRRFPRSAILGLVPAERVRRPQIADEGGSTERIAGAYRRLNLAGGRPQSMLGELSETERELFRERGRRMVECLIAHLDAEGPASAMAMAANRRSSCV